MYKKIIVQFAKFATVGVINTGVDWVVFFLLTLAPFFQTFESWAKAISFVLAATNSFIWNSLWTFRREFKSGMNQSENKVAAGSEFYVKFMVVSLIGFGLNLWAFTLARSYLFAGTNRLQQLFALALASAIVMVWNFAINKLWTYRQDKK
ncbi:MAG: GtrA family protein [Patescibacteria group bacterium]|nr:GtrA family protein [Patescibacteria group bacterium]